MWSLLNELCLLSIKTLYIRCRISYLYKVFSIMCANCNWFVTRLDKLLESKVVFLEMGL